MGSRLFAPRPFTTLLTLVLLVLLMCLGRWQIRRAGEKQALFDSFAQGSEATTPIDSRTAAVPRYQRVELQGSYDPSRQILVDNMVSPDGRAGYYVLTPFRMTDGAFILVNRGWVPLGGSRAARPDVAVGANPRRVRGRADHLPSAGIRLGTPQPLKPPYPVVAAFPQHADVERLLGDAAWSPAADSVLLDADQPDGYLRRWAAPGFPPVRHLAYAVQWFGLALALLVIYGVTNLRRAAPPDRESLP